VCAVKAPGFGENRKNNLQDIATLTGGQVRAGGCRLLGAGGVGPSLCVSSRTRMLSQGAEEQPAVLHAGTSEMSAEMQAGTSVLTQLSAQKFPALYKSILTRANCPTTQPQLVTEELGMVMEKLELTSLTLNLALTAPLHNPS